MLVYVKIIKKDGSNIDNKIFPAYELSYSKKSVGTLEEFKSARGEKTETLFTPKNESFEYIDLRFIDPHTGASRNLLAPECLTYILNSNGKTIDSIHCK